MKIDTLYYLVLYRSLAALPLVGESASTGFETTLTGGREASVGGPCSRDHYPGPRHDVKHTYETQNISFE